MGGVEEGLKGRAIACLGFLMVALAALVPLGLALALPVLALPPAWFTTPLSEQPVLLIGLSLYTFSFALPFFLYCLLSLEPVWLAVVEPWIDEETLAELYGDEEKLVQTRGSVAYARTRARLGARE